jgi:hypothetical protein
VAHYHPLRVETGEGQFLSLKLAQHDETVNMIECPNRSV